MTWEGWAMKYGKDGNKEYLVKYLNRFNIDTIENLRKLRFDTLQEMALAVARTFKKG